MGLSATIKFEEFTSKEWSSNNVDPYSIHYSQISIYDLYWIGLKHHTSGYRRDVLLYDWWKA